jgi:hypothetical protein
MKKLTEGLRTNDLTNLVNKVFEIDSYRSKIGDDQDVVVVTFTVDHQNPAKDLENFIEMGYDFVLDADVSPGETDDGTYKVFVELERGKHVAEQILEMLEGIELLTGIPDMRFRYFKSFKSQEATFKTLTNSIPIDKESYEAATEKGRLDNFSNFFTNSYADDVEVYNESISFKRIWKDTVTFNIVNSGKKRDVYDSIRGPMMIEGRDIAEIMFLSKFIGNFNITKIGQTFVFENENWAVALEKTNGK